MKCNEGSGFICIFVPCWHGHINQQSTLTLITFGQFSADFLRQSLVQTETESVKHEEGGREGERKIGEGVREREGERGREKDSGGG